MAESVSSPLSERWQCWALVCISPCSKLRSSFIRSPPCSLALARCSTEPAGGDNVSGRGIGNRRYRFSEAHAEGQAGEGVHPKEVKGSNFGGRCLGGVHISYAARITPGGPRAAGK